MRDKCNITNNFAFFMHQYYFRRCIDGKNIIVTIKMRNNKNGKFSYHSSNFAIAKVVALNLFASKSDNYRYRDSWKSDLLRLTQDAKKIKSDNFTRSNREKSNIAIAILEI